MFALFIYIKKVRLTMKKEVNMLDKIIEFLEQYVITDESIKKVGKCRTISAALLLLIDRQSFTKDTLRKELSAYIKRIISENEFNQLLDYDRAEYIRILHEV